MGPDDPSGGNTEPDSPNDTGSPVSLSNMSKSELLDYAESQGLTGLDGLTKAQIIEEVENNAV